MISNGENWHYLVVKNLSGLCIHSYRTENKLNAHKKYVKITIIVILKCLVLIII